MKIKSLVKKDRQPVKVEQQVTKVVFSEGMGDLVAKHFGVPAKHKEEFKLAYRLLPLNRARECIDIAYHLSINGGGVDDIQPWLERYERLAKKVLPRWAKVKRYSRDYLRQAYRALHEESQPALIDILFEFKGFVYAVFCRALMEQYGDAINNDQLEIKPSK